MIIVISKKNVQRCFSKERKPRHVFMPHSGIRGGGSLRSRDVAQSGSATVWGTGGRKFESCHPDKHKENQEPISSCFFCEQGSHQVYLRGKP